MNPGLQALEQLVDMGLFSKGRPGPNLRLQYWACGRPTPRQWVNAAGLVHVASSWVGKGISVIRGRHASEIVYVVDDEVAHG